MPQDLGPEADPRTVDDLITKMLMMAQMQQQGSVMGAAAMPRAPMPNVEQNYQDIQQALLANPQLGYDERGIVPGGWQGANNGMIPGQHEFKGDMDSITNAMRRPNIRYGRPYHAQEAYGEFEDQNTPGWRGIGDRDI